MPIQPLKRATLPSAIAEELRDMIARGDFSPGERIPAHRELARQFDVSVASVREALSSLMAAGLIEARPGQGTFVRRSAPDPFANLGWLGLPADRQELVEIVEARKVLEVQLAALAARRASPAQIERLRDLLARMEERANDPAAFLDADLAFHEAVAEAAANRPLRKALLAMRPFLRRDIELNIERARASPGSFRANITFDAHEQLVQAIEQRDPLRASELMSAILGRAEEFALAGIGEPTTAAGTN